MEEITKEEQKAAFELGNTTVAIKMLSGTNKTPKPRREIRLLFNKYIGIADRLGIHLQDPPPEETTTDTEMETFIVKQSNQVDECLARKGNMHINTLYHASYQMAFFFAFLTFKCEDNPQQTIQASERVLTCAEKLQECATELNIDLSEELEKAKNVKQMNEIIEIEKQMKEKFCGCKRSQNKRSEIDQTRIITNDVWTVSLVRLPDSRSSQHAFLVVEGKSGNTSKIWFLDFVANDQSDLYLPGMREGKVRVDFLKSNQASGSSNQLLFEGRKKMMKIHSYDRLLFSTWQIRKFTAETLIKNIQVQEANPPKYNILGNSKLAASSASSISKDTGHNCFTFARTMLHDLNDEYIMIPEDTLDKWICSPTSRFLVEKQFDYKSWKTPTSASVLALAFLAGVITAYYIPKLL